MRTATAGHHGTVIRAFADRQRVAVKVYSNRRAYCTELDLYTGILRKCSFVPRLVWQLHDRLVFEYCPFDLYDARKLFGCPSQRVLTTLVVQVHNALLAADALGLVYTDLKLENVMLSESGQVKLCDVSSFCKASRATQRNITLTSQFCPPEFAVATGCLFGQHASLWQIGALVLDVVTFQTVFPKCPVRPIASYLRPERMSRMISRLPECWRAPVSKLLTVEPHTRTDDKLNQFVLGAERSDHILWDWSNTINATNTLRRRSISA
jgi:serine/threonine protein kinase